jgi:PilZ domain
MTNSVRRVPRLTFSGRPAPRLETLDRSYEVVDLSEDGLRFRSEDHTGAGVTLGDVLRATIRFPANRTVEIEGQVLRVSGDEAALLLTRGDDRLGYTSLAAGPESPRRTGLLW